MKIFHGYDYSEFQNGTDYDRAQLIKGGVNFIIAPERSEKMQHFQKEAILLHNSITLCRSLLNDKQRFEVAFFETVRTLLSRMTSKGKVTKQEINARIGELLKQSVKSDGVINLFSDVKSEFSLFDTTFLDEISKMKEKNIAIELLKKLLAEKVKIYQKTNLIQAEKFSDMLNQSLSNYLKGLLSNEEVIQELLKLATEISQSEIEGNELGLTAEEKSFYDALTQPRAVHDFYTNEQLIAMTKELTEELRKNRTIDWQKKESARAGMRKMIKRLLKKYKYPPEEAANALETVIRQCEQWSDNSSEDYSANNNVRIYNFQENSYSIAAEPQAEYNKYVKGDMLMNVDGTLTENTGAFATAYEKEAKENNRLHVFVAEVDGEKKYVFPVYGAGLWGAIWGYVALNSDKDTVYGVYFSHASETPGLGAEIASTHFQGEFSGKKTLENGEVVLGVVKNGKVEKPDYQVDGISGGTITSVGVDAMLKACLSSYKNFLTNNNEEE